MSDNEKVIIDILVDRFLCWKLPDDFTPDCGVSFIPIGNANSWPVGTNLLTAEQARKMFECLLDRNNEQTSDYGSEIAQKALKIFRDGFRENIAKREIQSLQQQLSQCKREMDEAVAKERKRCIDIAESAANRKYIEATKIACLSIADEIRNG